MSPQSRNPQLKQLRVLVVDDAPMMCDLMRHLLGAVGVEQVETARNGDEAFGLMATWRPDVAFVDWEMSPINGIDFVRAVRRSTRSPNPYLPIIMVSGHAEPERVVSARDAGVHEYLVKPITPYGVLMRLGEVINRPREFLRTETYFGPAPRRAITPAPAPA